MTCSIVIVFLLVNKVFEVHIGWLLTQVNRERGTYLVLFLVLYFVLADETVPSCYGFRLVSINKVLTFESLSSSFQHHACCNHAMCLYDGPGLL